MKRKFTKSVEKANPPLLIEEPVTVTKKASNTLHPNTAQENQTIEIQQNLLPQIKMMQTTKLTFDELRSALCYTEMEIKDLQYKLSKVVVMQGQQSQDEVSRNHATWVDLLPHKTI